MSGGKETQNDDLMSELLSVKEEDYGENYKQHLLELYKMYVEMADNVSARRSKCNTFFLSVNTLLVTAIGILSELGSCFETLNVYWVLITSFSGILFCWTWLSTISSYRQLNSGKFKVIHLIEEKLPLAMYKAEWAYFKPKKGVGRYKQLTVVELWVPKIFAGVYFVLMIMTVVLLANSWIAQTLN